LVGLAAASFTEEQYQDAFTNWMQDFNKVYASHEFFHRFNSFKNNMDYVEKWNAQSSQTVLGLTHLADLTNEEYRSTFLGTWTDTSAPENVAEISFAPVADTVDWRTKGAVTGIKDQGQCGSCWSFSAAGAIEGAVFLAKGKLTSDSEQNLMDCSSSYGNQGCNGGLMTSAFKYVVANKGIDTEASYPYTAKDGTTCKFSVSNVGGTISNYKTVSAGSESALVTAIGVTPVSVAIDASHNSFQLYKTGIYYEPACSSSRLDHGVLAVGYGSTGATNGDYYIVKNSWGTSWGQAGYIQMARNRSNNCGIATQAAYPIV